ncbi:unnamed protein product [Heterobilharzia americana]|nr:unnamed protein product [Heterobilharzia americana]
MGKTIQRYYCCIRFYHFYSATITLCHFIPLQQTLQGLSQVGVTSFFNIAPYTLVEEDTGVMHTIPSPVITNEPSKQLKLDSSPNIHDEGLFACTNVRTLSGGENYRKHDRFRNHPICFLKNP